MTEQERKGYHLVATHIRCVQGWMAHAVKLWTVRMVEHDQSKYSTSELPLIQQKAKLDSLPLNSPEYQEALRQIKDAVQAHYKSNPHHPEHYPNGVRDMTLLDLLEMVCDWKAATELRGDDTLDSFNTCAERFKISDDLRLILLNTYKEMGWVEER